MITPSHPERVCISKPLTGPTQLRPAQSAPVRRESLPKQAAHDGNEGVTPSLADGGWYRPFAD